MTKLSEVSFESFSESFKQKYSELWSAATDAGTPEDTLDKVLENNYKQYQDMSVARVVTKTKSDIEFYTTDKISGCIIGSSDRYDSKAPVRYLLLKQDGKHIELSNFGHTTAYGDESEYTIPVPSLVTVRAKFDPEFNTWNLACIETIKEESLSHENLLSICNKIAISTKNITPDMSWSPGKSATPVVIKGKFAGFSPEVVFEKDSEGRAKVSETFSIYESNESTTMQPCFNFRLASSGGKFVRCHIKKQRYGKPLLEVEDLVTVCRDISGKITTPEDQCKKLHDWFAGMDVFVVGTVSSYKEAFGNDGKATTNVEITVFAVIEIPEDRVSGDVTQTTILKEPKDEAKGKPAKKTPAKPVDKPAEKPVEKPVEKPAAKVAESGKSDMAAVIHDLKIYCEAADISPEDLSLDVIKSRALDRFEDIPEGVLISAIMAVRDGN